MTFEALDLNSDSFPWTYIGLIGFIVSAIVLIMMAFGGSRAKVLIIPAILTALFFSGGLFAAIDAQHELEATEEHNIKVATSNLMAKYNVDEVDWEAKETTANPISETGKGEVVVEAKDGRDYIFKYKIDPKTSEPFLDDMPIRGGDAPEQAVTADSLLNK